MVGARILLALFCFSLGQTFFSFEPEKDKIEALELHIGEVLDYSLKAVSNINLSKRGVVLLSHLSSQKWRLVGHRKGFVVLTYVSLETRKEKQILIEVKELEKEISKKSENPYCSLEGVLCSERPLKISGKTKSWKGFYKLKKWCKDKKNCAFLLELNSLAKKKLEERLQSSLGFISHCELDSHGILYCSSLCKGEDRVSPLYKKEIKDILSENGISSYVPIFCRHKIQQKKFIVSSRVVLTSDNLAREIGVSKNFSQKIIANNFSFNTSFLNQLKFLENEAHFEIVGTPSLRLNEGVKSSSKTGGEISVIGEASSYRERQKVVEWKSYGLEISMTVHRLGENKVKASYHLKMAVPSASRSNLSLQNLELKGETTLNLKEPQVVGTTDYKREKKSKSKNIFLSSIPLIGPLFRLKKTEKVLSKMLLCLVVEEVL